MNLKTIVDIQLRQFIYEQVFITTEYDFSGPKSSQQLLE